MNIPEYYMYEAERCDNDEKIQGGLTITENGKVYIIQHDGCVDFHKECFDIIEVKPETVRRVAVKPVQKEKHYWNCPNCDVIVADDDERYIYDDVTECCSKCGIALDWNI